MARLTEFQLTYDMSDTTALADADIDSDSNKDFCDIGKIKNIRCEYGNRMTLEHNFCTLNGTQLEFEDYPNDIPFFTEEMSDENGEFETNPTIEILFYELHSSYGLTLNFIDDYPLELRCAWYRNNNIIFTNTYAVNSRNYIIKTSVQNYDKIVLEFTKTLPYRYVKMNYISFGVILLWDENAIKSGKLSLEMDPITSRIPENTLTFEIIDTVDETNPGNAEGLHNYFQRNQIMYPSEVVNAQEIKFAKFFLKDFSYSKNVCKITATSVLGLFDKIPFDSPGVSCLPNNENNPSYFGQWLSKIFDCVYTQANLYGRCNWSCDTELEWLPIYFGIKPGCSCKEALQQLLFAVDAIIDVTDCNLEQRDGHYDIQVTRRASSISGIIERDTKFSTKVKKTEFISGVQISYGVLKWKLTDANNEYFFDATLEPGVHSITLDKARFNITPNEFNGTVSSTGYVVSIAVYPGTAQHVILKSEYIEDTWEERYVLVQHSNIEAGAGVNIKKFKTTLCNEATATTLARQLLEYYNNRLEIDIKNLIVSPAVRLNEQWLIQNSTTGLNDYIGRYTQRNIDLVKGFIDNAKLVGYYNDTMDVQYYVRTDVSDIEVFTDDNEVI